VIRPASPLDLLRLRFAGPQPVLQLDAPQSLIAGQTSPLGFVRRLLDSSGFNRQPLNPIYVLLHRSRVLAYVSVCQDVRATASGTSWTLTGLGIREGSPDNDEIAEMMLEAVSAAAGQQEITRLFARVPDDVSLIATLSRAGFQPYAEETIWVKPSLAERSKEGPVPAYLPRPQARRDAWALFQLYLALTPTAVHHAEGYSSSHWQTARPLPPPLHASQNYLWDDGRAIRAYLHTASGPGGHVAELLAAADCEPMVVEAALNHAIYLLRRQGANKPLYIPLRDYQPGLQSALESHGFRPLLRQVAMVKYTTTWVRSPAQARHPLFARRSVANREAVPVQGGLVINSQRDPQPH